MNLQDLNRLINEVIDPVYIKESYDIRGDSLMEIVTDVLWDLSAQRIKDVEVDHCRLDLDINHFGSRVIITWNEDHPESLNVQAFEDWLRRVAPSLQLDYEV